MLTILAWFPIAMFGLTILSGLLFWMISVFKKEGWFEVFMCILVIVLIIGYGAWFTWGMQYLTNNLLT
ncbi:MAG: hypothetical protein KAS32_21850 [Candidatus Peribacteraceae bacterium]|nr:hypothetical protein [Candidatus Peribacteraceae bacterium]